MFTMKINWQPDRSRQEAIKARIKDRRKAALESDREESYKQEEKANAKS